MRLISWNCCDAFARKFGHLERLHPDIAVVSEVRPECLRSAGLFERSLWIGDPGQKGLAVIPYGEWRISGDGLKLDEKWFAPVQLSNGAKKLHLVGVWLDTRTDCVPPTLAALNQLTSFVAEAPTVFAGDFNQSAAFDAKRRSGRRFEDVLKRLVQNRLVSAWHMHTGEGHGAESSATLYWRWQRDSRFHIDFIFFPPEFFHLSAALLGSYEQYVETKISDHVPVVADLVWRSEENAEMLSE